MLLGRREKRKEGETEGQKSERKKVEEEEEEGFWKLSQG